MTSLKNLLIQDQVSIFKWTLIIHVITKLVHLPLREG